jgi:hypothetical protein
LSTSRSPRPPFLQGNLFSLAFFAAWCLVVGSVLIWTASALLGVKARFDAAPTCISATDLSGCRYHGTGRIERTYYLKGRWHVDMAVDGAGGGYSADFAPVDAGTVTSWPVNGPLLVELWNGQPVRVGGLRTESNPDAVAQPYEAPVGLVVAGLGAAIAAVCAWQLVLYREALRQRARKLAGDDPNVQVLPLTPAMKHHLGSLAGAGARHDLERGIFLRELGPFDVHVMPALLRAAAVTVSVGGRSLRPVVSNTLAEVPAGTGAVDYLPATGEVMALRDASGNPVWARLATTAPAAAVQSAAR